MQSFKDTAGKFWEMTVTVSTVKRVKSLCGIDILKIMDGGENSVMMKLAEDVCLLVDVLYAVCKPEADKIGITDEMFGERLNGDILEEQSNQLIEAISFFLPETQGKLIRTSLNRAKAEQKKAEAELLKILETE